jgi:hypothetical protein
MNVNKKQSPLPGHGVSTLLLVISTIAAVALVLSLARQNMVLKDALARVEQPRGDSPQVGEMLPIVDLLSLGGDPRTVLNLSPGGGAIAFFTTTCRFCELSLEPWTRLNTELLHDGLPLVGVSLNGAAQTAAFVSSKRIPWPVWVLKNSRDRARLGIAAVPLTVLISSKGEIVETWRGALDDSDVDTILEVVRQESGVSPASSQPTLKSDSCCSAPLIAATSDAWPYSAGAIAPVGSVTRR